MGRMVEDNIIVTDLYKEIYKDEGLTQWDLVPLLGLKGQSGVARIIQRGATLNNLYKLIKAIGGYRLVVEKVSEKGKVQKKYIIGE